MVTNFDLSKKLVNEMTDCQEMTEKIKKEVPMSEEICVGKNPDASILEIKPTCETVGIFATGCVCQICGVHSREAAVLVENGNPIDLNMFHAEELVEVLELDNAKEPCYLFMEQMQQFLLVWIAFTLSLMMMYMLYCHYYHC
ncbi:unnamed protein product [Caenorhabditis angaria]|uniref:Uncharacterized protein n=1 Tax=Caenorhabditis angaria TaxID=860376 RepID=A0A9P1J1U4_9PELO|nr:unnamed protein product [Caenorhabditis angaria]